MMFGSCYFSTCAYDVDQLSVRYYARLADSSTTTSIESLRGLALFKATHNPDLKAIDEGLLD